MWGFLKKKPKERQPLLFQTDMHCHIVPGVDDGSPDVETSIELLDRMASWGLKRVITTPHMTQDTFENTPDVLDPAFEELRAAADKAGINVQLGRTCEHRVDDFFLDQLQKGLIVPFPNRYILVENSFVQEPWNIDQVIFDLKLRGYKPIMAHPERFYYYHNHRERYDRLHQMGNLFQINLLSLSGYYGKTIKATAEWMLEKGYADFIGTDLHHHRHADSIEEYLTSRDYRRLLDSKPDLLNDTAFNPE